MRSRTICWKMGLLLLLPLAARAAEPPEGALDARAPVEVRSSIGEEPIRTSNTPVPSAPAAPDTSARGTAGEMDYSRVLGALAVVIGLILLLRYLARVAFPASLGRGGTARSVELLSRSPLSPKQQILLVRVGRRVIVVGDSGGQMSSLGEIRDADEISELVGQVLSDKRAIAPRAFGSMFGRFRRNFDDAPEPQTTAEEVDRTDEDAAGERRAVAETRDELNGLRARVRLLASEFGTAETEGT